MSSAPKLYVDELAGSPPADERGVRPATPAEVAAWLKAHHPEVLLQEAAEVWRKNEPTIHEPWSIDDLADRLEAERKGEGNG